MLIPNVPVLYAIRFATRFVTISATRYAIKSATHIVRRTAQQIVPVTVIPYAIMLVVERNNLKEVYLCKM